MFGIKQKLSIPYVELTRGSFKHMKGTMLIQGEDGATTTVPIKSPDIAELFHGKEPFLINYGYSCDAANPTVYLVREDYHILGFSLPKAEFSLQALSEKLFNTLDAIEKTHISIFQDAETSFCLYKNGDTWHFGNFFTSAKELNTTAPLQINAIQDEENNCVHFTLRCNEDLFGYVETLFEASYPGQLDEAIVSFIKEVEALHCVGKTADYIPVVYNCESNSNQPQHYLCRIKAEPDAKLELLYPIDIETVKKLIEKRDIISVTSNKSKELTVNHIVVGEYIPYETEATNIKDAVSFDAILDFLSASQTRSGNRALGPIPSQRQANQISQYDLMREPKKKADHSKDIEL